MNGNRNGHPSQTCGLSAAQPVPYLCLFPFDMPCAPECLTGMAVSCQWQCRAEARCFALLLYEYLSRRTWFRFGFWCSMLMLMLMLTLIANGAQLPYGKLMRSAWQCWSVSAVKCGMILEFNSDSVAWEDRFSMLFVLCYGMLCCVQSRSRLQLLHHSAVCSDVMWRELSWHC